MTYTDRKQCPHCHHAWPHDHEKDKRFWKDRAWHSSSCPNQTERDARISLKFYLEESKRLQERVHAFAEHARRWEGKYRVVCHENNQLRKRLTAADTRTPAEPRDAADP